MINARTELVRLINGFQASQAIYVAATLGLADQLRDGAASAAEMARSTGAHPDALYRLVRVLAAIGVVESVGTDRFALTAMGDFLRRDASGTCAPMAELFGRPNIWQAWGDLLHTVQTGDTAFDHVHGCSVWDYRSRHPDEAGIFDRAMASGTEKIRASRSRRIRFQSIRARHRCRRRRRHVPVQDFGTSHRGPWHAF